MILEASVYEVRRVPPRERKDRYGLLVLVMRQWPRRISRNLIDMWIKDASPGLEILSAYRQGQLSIEDFEQRYEAELRARQSCKVRHYTRIPDTEEYKVVEEEVASPPLEYLRHLEQLHQKVTLLCWEPEPPCHRYFLLRWLSEEKTNC